MYKLTRNNRWPWNYVLRYGDLELAEFEPAVYSTRDTGPDMQVEKYPATEVQDKLLKQLVAKANSGTAKADMRLVKGVMFLFSALSLVLLASYVANELAGLFVVLASLYAFMGFREVNREQG